MAVEMTQTLNQNAPNFFTHVAGLSAVWQKYMSEVYGPDCRDLHNREHGQLGRLKRSLGMKQATEVVDYAIRNWCKFARRAAQHVGSDIIPPTPSVGWLCQYHATALLMMHEEMQSKKQAEAEQANKEAQAKVVLQIAAKAVHEVEHKPATLEELEAIESEVEAGWAAKETLSA